MWGLQISILPWIILIDPTIVKHRGVGLVDWGIPYFRKFSNCFENLESVITVKYYLKK